MMKKLLILLMVMLGLYCQLKAQYKIGFRAGPNIAWTNSETEETDPIIGYHIGVFSWIELNEKIKILPEFTLSEQGFSEGDNVKTITRIRYIQLPVLLKYQFEEFFILAGPQVASAIGAKYIIKNEDNTERIPATADINNIQYSGILGMGFQINNNFAVQIRYQHAFSKMFNPAFDTFDHNHSVQLSFTYQLP